MAAHIHYERSWFYMKGADRIVTGDATKATGTYWDAQDRHPVDHHEFGLRLIIDDQVITDHLPPAQHRQELQLALDRYLTDTPDGLDNPAVTV